MFYEINCKANPSTVCDKAVKVKRLDDADGLGFTTSYARYFREDGVLYRDLLFMRGAKITFEVRGIYTAPSLYKIVL